MEGYRDVTGSKLRAATLGSTPSNDLADLLYGCSQGAMERLQGACGDLQNMYKEPIGICHLPILSK